MRFKSSDSGERERAIPAKARLAVTIIKTLQIGGSFFSVGLSVIFKLGEFVSEHEIDGTTFYLKGLTVGQFDDLMVRGFIGQRIQKSSALIMIALTGVVGWEDLQDKDSLEMIEFDREILEQLPDPILRELGSVILNQLTDIPSDIASKLRGHIRFAYWLGEDKNKTSGEYFNCSKCIKAKKYATRPCGLTADEREAIAGRDADEDEKVAEEIAKQVVLKKQLKKMRTKKFSVNPPKKVQDNDSSKRTMKLNSFEYPECPITWIDTWVSTLADHMLHCDRANITYFNGGLADQPMKMYRIKKIVSSEVNQIESDRMKKDK